MTLQPARYILFYLLLTFLVTLNPLKAFAGQQYVDKSGYAVSGYDVVAYRSLEQNPVGEAQPNAIPGKADITAQWNNATWAFSSIENRDKFLENPEYFAPAYDGHCAYGAAVNGKVNANPHLWRIVDDRLYLNTTATVVGIWEGDISGNIINADTNWENLAPEPAATKPVPKLDTTLAPQN